MKKLNLKTLSASDFCEELPNSELLDQFKLLVAAKYANVSTDQITIGFEIGPEFNGHILTISTDNLNYCIPLFLYEEDGFWYDQIVAKDRSFTVVQECKITGDYLKVKRFDSLDLAFNFFAKHASSSTWDLNH